MSDLNSARPDPEKTIVIPLKDANITPQKAGDSVVNQSDETIVFSSNHKKSGSLDDNKPGSLDDRTRIENPSFSKSSFGPELNTPRQPSPAAQTRFTTPRDPGVEPNSAGGPGAFQPRHTGDPLRSFPANTKEDKTVSKVTSAFGVGAAALGGLAAGVVFGDDIKNALSPAEAAAATPPSSTADPVTDPVDSGSGQKNEIEQSASAITDGGGSSPASGLTNDVPFGETRAGGTAHPNNVGSGEKRADGTAHPEPIGNPPSADTNTPEITEQPTPIPGDTSSVTSESGEVKNGEIIDYTTQKGDTLSEIAQEHHTSVDHLMSINPQIQDPDMIFAGAHLRVPTTDNENNPYAKWNPDSVSVTDSQDEISNPDSLSGISIMETDEENGLGEEENLSDTEYLPGIEEVEEIVDSTNHAVQNSETEDIANSAPGSDIFHAVSLVDTPNNYTNDSQVEIEEVPVEESPEVGGGQLEVFDDSSHIHEVEVGASPFYTTGESEIEEIILEDDSTSDTIFENVEINDTTSEPDTSEGNVFIDTVNVDDSSFPPQDSVLGIADTSGGNEQTFYEDNTDQEFLIVGDYSETSGDDQLILYGDESDNDVLSTDDYEAQLESTDFDDYSYDSSSTDNSGDFSDFSFDLG